MNLHDKLRLLQRLSGLSQTQLAEKIGVSFVAFNNWWTGKSKPHPKTLKVIDALYLEITGQKIIPREDLSAKKAVILKKSKQNRNILKRIIDRPDIYDQIMLELTYNSNSIEGSTLTENETAAILFRNASLPKKSLIEQLEAKNHQTAVQYLFNYLLEGEKIDDNLLLKLHSILMNGIHSEAGLFRRHSVRIVGSNVPTANYLKIPVLMDQLISDINKSAKDDILIAAEIHSRFEQIHPFYDGNGRIGRLLLHAMLLRKNIAPAVIKQEKKQLYYTFLSVSQIKNDSSQLQDFICDAVMDGFDIVTSIC